MDFISEIRARTFLTQNMPSLVCYPSNVATFGTPRTTFGCRDLPVGYLIDSFIFWLVLTGSKFVGAWPEFSGLSEHIGKR